MPSESLYPRGSVHSDVPIARQALRKLMGGPIAFNPVVRDGRKGYELKWETKVGVLLSTPCYKGVASPRGSDTYMVGDTEECYRLFADIVITFEGVI